jgi:hypothetical protein
MYELDIDIQDYDFGPSQDYTTNKKINNTNDQKRKPSRFPFQIEDPFTNNIEQYSSDSEDENNRTKSLISRKDNLKNFSIFFSPTQNEVPTQSDLGLMNLKHTNNNKNNSESMNINGQKLKSIDEIRNI